MLKKILKFVSQHKIITAIIILVIVFGGYFGYKAIKGNNQQTRYVLASVEKGTLIVSVSGSGQISSLNQVDIKPKVSGDVVYVGVKNGQEVKKGGLLVQIDASDAKRELQDAEINLETAQVQLQELLEPPDELGALQAENSLTKAKNAKKEAENNIIEGYEDAFNAVTDVFFDLPGIMAGLNNILYGYDIADSEKTLSGYWNTSALINSISINDRDQLERFIDKDKNAYNETSIKYSKNFNDYKNTSRYAEEEAIENLLEETLDTLRSAAEVVKNEINMLDFWVNSRSKRNERIFGAVTDYQSDLKSYNSKTNSYLSNLLQVQRSFEDNKQVVLDAEYSIKEKELSLEKLMEGPDDFDIRTKKIVIQQKEATLVTARENLAGCYVHAPFDGIITKVNVEKGDSVSGNTTVATLITKQRIAEISLNEIDVAKVKAGQKVTLTFDAIDGLEITGEVAEVDSIGTVSQGVVSYNIKIGFDTQDDRIKPGMSVSTSIIIDVKQNVLLIPNSAVKSQGDIYYVETLSGSASQNQATANVSGITSNTLPGQQQIEIGSTNDTYSEVTSGLKEGDTVVTQTITSTSSNSSNQQNNSFRMPGVGGGGFRGD
jgi:HlyD family secretion protein